MEPSELEKLPAAAVSASGWAVAIVRQGFFLTLILMAKATPYVELPFPLGGLNIHSGFTHQAAGTAIDCLNVRAYDPTTNYLRGSQRCGHTKYVATQLNGGNFIQNINQLIVALANVPSNGTSVRDLVGVAVAGGTVKTFTRSGFHLPTNGTGALSSTCNYMGSSVLNVKLYYADGKNWKYYDPSDDTVHTWTASAGSLPVDGDNNTPLLICTWRGRIVLSGLLGDPANWFMSRQFDATDWDYSPAITDATMPVAGNNTEAGLVSDRVNSLMPYSDDLLLFGGDHSLWQMTEDPAAGGQLDRISDIVGTAFGTPWCKDNAGNLYFLGSRGSLYVCQPTPGATAAPIRISSEKVDERLLTIDFSENVVRMVWDDRFQTVMFYITPMDGGPASNWAYDVRQGAFWPDEFGLEDHNVTACWLFDGDDPNDRAVLLGCIDGYIRYIDLTAKTDDGQAIESYVYLGPLQGASSKLRVKELRAVMGENSDQCTLEINVGHSPEAAYNSAFARWAGTLQAGKNYAMRPGTTGQAQYVVISNKQVNCAWQFEALYADIVALGKASGRQL